MIFRHHHYPRGDRFIQVMWWHWRGVIVRIGDHQFDLFWRPQWSRGVED